MTKSQYPPLRSTAFRSTIWTSCTRLDSSANSSNFISTHVPARIRLADHIGNDTPREALLREILILTKMNWNSARLGGLLPITLRFSRLVGDIMREIGDWEPLTNFKYYT